jgi:hypothetical protein
MRAYVTATGMALGLVAAWGGSGAIRRLRSGDSPSTPAGPADRGETGRIRRPQPAPPKHDGFSHFYPTTF